MQCLGEWLNYAVSMDAGEIEGCWLCDEFETCEKLQELIANHGDAHIKNLRKIKRKGIDGFLDGTKYWYVKPKASS